MNDKILDRLAPHVHEAPVDKNQQGMYSDATVDVVTDVSTIAAKGGCSMEDALSHLPPEVALRIATVSARYGIHENNDPFWGVVEVMQNAFECAKASGTAAAAAEMAAEELARNVQTLPKTMQEALRYASQNFEGQLSEILGKNGGKFIGELQMRISKAADDGAEKLKKAASTLDNDLTRKIAQRKDDGIDLWVQCANDAANLALAKHKAVNFYFNTLGGSSIFIIGVVVGVFITKNFV